MSCSVVQSCGSDLVLLWLWLGCRPQLQLQLDPSPGTSRYRRCSTLKNKNKKQKTKKKNKKTDAETEIQADCCFSGIGSQETVRGIRNESGQSRQCCCHCVPHPGAGCWSTSSCRSLGEGCSLGRRALPPVLVSCGHRTQWHTHWQRQQQTLVASRSWRLQVQSQRAKSFGCFRGLGGKLHPLSLFSCPEVRCDPGCSLACRGLPRSPPSPPQSASVVHMSATKFPLFNKSKILLDEGPP